MLSEKWDQFGFDRGERENRKKVETEEDLSVFSVNCVDHKNSREFRSVWNGSTSKRSFGWSLECYVMRESRFEFADEKMKQSRNVD